ncbi:hypothetical protein LCGC14_2266640, partial [marine sediment metagenome]
VIAAILHAHPQILSIARRVLRKVQKSYKSVNTDRLLDYVRKSNKTIYYQGGHYKNYDKIKVIILDKCFESQNSIKTKEEQKGLVVIRNPFATLESSHYYGCKYNVPERVLTPKKIHTLIKRYTYFLRRSVMQDNLLLLYEDFVKDPLFHIARIHNFLNVEPIKFQGFHYAFDKYNCVYCQQKLITRYTDSSAASVAVSQQGLTFPRRKHFYCSFCDKFTLGYGSFNPYEEIKQARNWRKSLPENFREIIFENLEKRLGNEMAGKFLKETIISQDFKRA